MLKRITTAIIAMYLILPMTTPASAHSILWAATSDHTDLIKDEEYEAAPVLMMVVPGLDDDASPMVEGTDGGLEILYEELVAEELDGVEEEPVQPELTGVKEEPDPEPISVEDEAELPPEAELEEIELEEPLYDEIQIP